MMAMSPNHRFAHLATAPNAKAPSAAGRWVWDPNAPAPVPILTQMKAAAASLQKSKALAARKSKALTTASRVKPRPACRFAHLNAVRPGDLAAAVQAVRDDGRGAAPRRATVHGFHNSKRAAAFILAAAAKARPYPKGA